MLAQIHNWLHSPTKSRRISELKAAARAHFAEFVIENPIDDCQYMKQVEERRGERDLGMAFGRSGRGLNRSTDFLEFSPARIGFCC